MTSQPNEFVRLLGASDVVHQATGMISVQIAATMLHAAHRLLAAAEETGRPVECVSRDVVARRLRFDRRLDVAPIPSMALEA